MKIIFKSIILLNLIIQLLPANLYSLPIDLTKSEIYLKRGFSTEWINSLPEGNSWKKIPPAIDGKRKIRVSEIKLEGIPERYPLSITSYSMENYTLVTSFELSQETQMDTKVLGLYLAQIGLNWEIYLNGLLLKREMHLSNDGNIVSSRNHRDMLEYIHPSYLNEGRNILAFHIIGDPYYNETGFYLSSPYVIDDYKKLLEKNSETITLILISIYLFLGIYHLFLFISRTKEKYNLYFGVFIIFFCIHQFMRTHTIYSIISDTTIITRIELAAVFCLFPTVGFFLSQIVLNRIVPFLKYYSTFCGIMVLSIIPFPLAFLTDILRIWQFTAIVPLVYFAIIGIKILLQTLKEIGDKENSEQLHRFPFLNTIRIFSKTTIGNLLIGILVLIPCIVFDILDSVYFASGIALVKYGFFIFLMGITFVLTNRFQFIHSLIEDLNIDLQKKIIDLNEANIQISLSQEKYKLLVEGTNDIIFSLDNNWKFITVNMAIWTHLNIKPQDVISKSIFDFMNEDKDVGTISQQFLREKFEEFSMTRESIHFKAEFCSPLMGESKEMDVHLEYITTKGKNEILGKASRRIEDSLIKYFISENQNYSISNYLFAADETSQRLTRNLGKFLSPKQISLLRIALREIIINSIEHGNLEISFDEKTESIKENKYFEIIGKRRNDPRYNNRHVSIEYSINANEVVYLISDEGNGFDYKEFLKKDTRMFDGRLLSHGRGIFMAKKTFDYIDYSDNGKSVVLKKYFN